MLGQHLRPGMEIDVALHSHGIPAEWPDEVLEQAAAFSPTVDGALAANRKDVRSLSLITIDGADARDFDDAVWCERLDNGWRLMVAIADVAHYVSAGSALDKEAVDRGTSVYFPGRVVPMLPEVLSNGLCSLNPEVDRLCMLCELTLDEKAKVKKTRFHNGIMRSHARLTYDQVSEMLTDNASELRYKHAPLVPMIEELHNLYKALAKKRRKRGAIEFDSNETHIVFDDNKKIKEIIPIQRNDAHKLIEECMILANIEAAAFLEGREVPALYRVHAGPKSDRLEDLRAFLALRSLTLGGGDLPSALDYAALAEKIADRPDRSVIQTVMLRSMQQAVYQPKNEGHFGLALSEYAHFTSPIRRYPDLLVHRAIKFAIENQKLSDYLYSKEAMVALGESCSMTERRAEDASRDVVAWLKCEYMQDHVGSDFPGVITAVTSFGLFVELVGIHVEGLVHITNLSHDYYRFEQAAHALTGERTGKQYHLGDPIVVKVAAVNLEDRKIDFTEVSHHSESSKRPHAPKHAHAGNDAVAGKRKKRKSKKQRLREAAARDQSQTVSSSSHGHTDKNSGKQKVLSAEQKRQNKRKLKQKRRNEKRAARKEAKRLESLRADANRAAGQLDSNSVAAAQSGGKSSKNASSTAAKQSRSSAKANAKTGSKASAVEIKKSTAVDSSAVSKNASAKASAATSTKTAAKAGSKKASAKTATAVNKKNAAKAHSKKTSAKASAVVSKKKSVAKKASAKASAVNKKTAAKALNKKASAKTSNSANKKLAKKANAAVGKKRAAKAGSAIGKKALAKAATPISKKSAKKTNSAVSKKVAKKSSASASKKIAKKSSASVSKKIQRNLCCEVRGMQKV